MNEVSDSSSTSGAPETSVRLLPPGQLRKLSQQDAANGSDLFNDRILTVSSPDNERPWPVSANRSDHTIALGASASAGSELRMASDEMSAPGITQDAGLAITESSASHVGDIAQSDPPVAPNLGDPRPSQAGAAASSLAERSLVAKDVSELPATASWHDAASATHRNGELSRGTANFGDDAESAGAFDHTRHADQRISPPLDIPPLDSLLAPPRHHRATADDDAQSAHGSQDRPAPILDVAASAHASAVHANAAHQDPAPAHSDALAMDGVLDHHDDAGHVSANHHDAASSGAAGLVSDDVTIHQASTTPPSAGALVESGAKAVLAATDESPNRIGPHASAADFALSAAPSHVHAAAHATAAFSPGVLGARDQLASAIATATPDAAAMTTLPPSQITGAAIPTLGGDMHALQKHAA